MAGDPYRSARGFTIGGVLARAFGAIGSAPVAFFGVGALFTAAPSLLFRLTMGTLFTPARLVMLPHWWPLFAVGGLGWWVLYLFAQTLLFLLTAAAGEGRRPGAGPLLAAAAGVLPLVLLQAILLTFALTLASVFLLVPAIVLWLIWAVAAPALAIERDGLFAAFGRSRGLTAGARWPIVALVLLVFAIYAVASGVVGIGTLLVHGLGAVATPTGPVYVVGAILSALLQTAFITIWSAIKAALFLDLRDWKDGPAGDRLAGIFA